MRRPRAACALIALALAGCGPIGWTRVSVNRPLAPAQIAFIVPGTTSWDEVTQRLGAPDGLAATTDGTVIDYRYSDSKSFSVDFGWPLNFVSPISYFPHELVLGGQGIGLRTFEVAFDARGVVAHAGFLRGEGAAEYKVWPFEPPKADQQ